MAVETQEQGTRTKTKYNMENLPPLDINLLIRNIAAVAKEEKSVTAAMLEIAKPYLPLAEIYVKSQAQELIEDSLRKFGPENLSDKDFSKRLDRMAEKT